MRLAEVAARKSAEEGKGSPARYELGLLMLALRMRSVDSEGRTDWAGSSREYRDRLSEVFRRTNMTPDERARTSGAARKAAGNILREVLTGDELEAYGLMQASPAERSRAAHQTQWVPAEVARLAKTSPATDVRADPVRLIQGALGVLLRVSSDAVAALSDEERASFAQLVSRIEDRAYDLRMLVTPSDD